MWPTHFPETKTVHGGPMMLDWPVLQARLHQHVRVSLDEILLDFQGPQIAVWSIGGTTHLGVASDEQDDMVRWLAAPLTTHELHAIRLGTMALRDVLSQSHLVVIDQNGKGDVTLYGAISLADVPENAFPEHGAPLPSAVTSHYRTELEAGAGEG